MVSLPAIAAVGAGSLVLYGGVTGKSVLVAAQSALTGKSPSSAPDTQALVTQIGGPSGVSPSIATAPNIIGNAVTGQYSTQITAYFLSQGASKAQTAGALGNIQIESGFDPSNPNPSEGAIGFCQWEGGRRTNLQKFAAAMGKSETDATAQIQFIWHELRGSELAAYTAWKATSSPSAAAAVWDAMYERSDGTARAKREAAAVSWFKVI